MSQTSPSPKPRPAKNKPASSPPRRATQGQSAKGGPKNGAKTNAGNIAKSSAAKGKPAGNAAKGNATTGAAAARRKRSKNAQTPATKTPEVTPVAPSAAPKPSPQSSVSSPTASVSSPTPPVPASTASVSSPTPSVPAAKPSAPASTPSAPIATASVPVAKPSVPAARGSRWPLWLAGGTLGVLVALAGLAFGTYQAWRGGKTIAPNVFIAGQAVGGLTKLEARQRLEARFSDLKATIVTPEENFQFSLEELGGAPDLNRAVNDAFWLARTGSILQNAPRVLWARFDETHLPLRFRWDKERLKERVRRVADEYRQPAKNAALQVSGAGVTVLPEEAGRAMNLGATLARLQKVYGLNSTSIEATVREDEPKLTAADLEGTDVKLGTHTTTFNRGLVGRTRNIHVASATVDGKVLMPGETFSFNACTGERTWEKGYRMAHIFERKPGKEESEVVDGLAGGVCQVSSTLYNAVRKGNQKLEDKLTIVQRESHSLPVPYVPRGLDATVAWPYKDFKFRNDLPHPVYLRAAVAGSRLNISVWARVPSGHQLLAKTAD